MAVKGFAGTPKVKFNSLPDIKLPQEPTAVLGQPLLQTEKSGSEMVDDRLISSLTARIGGGQYSSDPNLLNEVSKTDRADFTAQQAKVIRGGMDSRFVEIEHVIPLWAGGTNDPSNLQPFFYKDHDKKTKVEAVARKLYQEKKIDLGEARNISINWRDKNADNINFVDDYGNVDLNTAETKFKEWQEPIKVGVKEALAAHATFLPFIGKTIEKNLSPGSKLYLEAYKEGPESIVGQTTQSLASALTLGRIPFPTREFTGIEKPVAEAGKLVGGVTGSVLSFGLLGKALGGIGKVSGITKSLQATKTGQKVVQALETERVLAQMGVKKKLLGAESLYKMSANAGLFALGGQLQKFEEDTIKNRVEQLFHDLTLGVVTGKAGYGVRGISGVGATSFSLSYIMGDDVANSFMNGAVMAVLHGAGGKFHEAGIKDMTNKEALRKATEFKNKYIESPKEKPTKTEIKQEADKLYENILKTHDPESEAGLIAEELSKAQLVTRLQYKETLPKALRDEADVADMLSIATHMQSDTVSHNKLPVMLNEFIDKNPDFFGGKREKPLDIKPVDPTKIVEGTIQVTGYGAGIDAKVTKDIAETARAFKQGKTDGNAILVIREDLDGHMKQVNKKMDKKAIERGEQKQYEFTNKNVQLYKIVNGEMKELSFIPRSERIEGLPNSINENVRIHNQLYPEIPLKEFDPNIINKNTVFDKMRDNGVEVLKVKITNASDGTGNFGVKTRSGEPFLHIELTKDGWNESVARNKGMENMQQKRSKGILSGLKNMFKKPGYKTVENIPVSTPVKTQAADQLKSRADMVKLADTFKTELETGNPKTMIETLENKFGELPEKSKNVINELFNAKEKVTIGDIFDVIPARAAEPLLYDQDFNKLWKDGYADEVIFERVRPVVETKKPVKQQKVKKTIEEMNVEELQAEKTKRIEKFRKEAGMMVKKEEKGVKYREVEDATGNTNFTAKEFSLKRAKSQSAKEKRILVKESETLLYENDPEFKKLQDTLDTKLEQDISQAEKLKEQDKITEELYNEWENNKIPQIKEEINNIEQYDQQITKEPREVKTTQETPKESREVNREKTEETAPITEVSDQVPINSLSEQKPEISKPDTRTVSVISKAPKRGLDAQESLESVQSIAKEDLTKDSSFGNKIMGIVEPVYNKVTLKQQELLAKGENVKALDLGLEKGKFTAQKMEAKARLTLEDKKGDHFKAFDQYVKDLNDWAVKNTDSELVTTYNQKQDLKRYFNRFIESGAKYKYVYKNGKLDVVKAEQNQPISWGEETTAKYKEDNFITDKEALKVISFDEGESNFGIEIENKIDMDSILRSELLKKGYVTLGFKSNEMSSRLAVKYYKPFVDMYDANPKNYPGSSFDPGTPTTKEAKFLRVYTKEVLGLSKETSAQDFNKRLALIHSEEVKNKMPVTDIANIVLPSRSLGDVQALDMSHLKGSSKEAIKAANEVKIHNGKDFWSETLAKDTFHHNGFLKDKSHAKTTTVEKLEDGLWIEKSDSTVATKEFIRRIEEEYGIDIKKLTKGNKYFKITFGDNIKMGLGTGEKASTKLGDAYIKVTSSDSMRIKYLSDPAQESAFPLSNIAKFGVKDGVNKEIVTAFKEDADLVRKLLEEVNSSDRNVYDILQKYKKDLGISAEHLHGLKPELMKMGLGKKYMQHEVENILLNTFMDRAIRLKSKTIGRLYSTPDMGYYKNGKLTYLKANETFLPRAIADSLGIREGDNVLMWRNPTSRKTSMVKMKIMIAENHGIDWLGKEHMITSNHDTVVRFEADHDGDTYNFVKLDTKDGISSKIADAVEAERAREGDILLSPIPKGAKQPLTPEGLKTVREGQIKGMDGINASASRLRVLQTLVDNDVSIRVGGKNYKFKLDQDTKTLLAQIMQEGVDAGKSPFAISERLKKSGEKDIFSYILKRSLKTEGSKIEPGQREVVNNFSVLKEANRIIKDYQDVFNFTKKDSGNPPKSVEDLNGRISMYNRLSEEVLRNGGKLSAIQEVLMEYDGIAWENLNPSTKVKETSQVRESGKVKDIEKTITVMDKERYDLWEKAKAGLKEEFGEEYKDVLQDKKIMSFVNEMKKAKIEYNRDIGKNVTDEARKIHRSEVRDKLIKKFFESEFTQEQKDAIAYLALSNEYGNIRDVGYKYGPGKTMESRYIRLPEEIMAQSEKITRKFAQLFEGQEKQAN